MVIHKFFKMIKLYFTKLIRRIFLRYAVFWEKFGIEIVPDHFYSPVPNIDNLPDKFFTKESQCIGIDWNIELQKNHLLNIFRLYVDEIPENFDRKMLSSVDAAVYYSMIRHYTPKKIIEIGCGESTKVAASACLKNNMSLPCKLTGIEPYPSKEIEKGFCGLTKLIPKKVQNISLNEFKDCDMLFIDSSHIVKYGSDVIYEIMEILPILKTGTIIHFHDIFLPKEYIKEFADQRLFFNEQYMLFAFLAYNNSFHVIWGSVYMKLHHKDLMKNIFKKHYFHKYPVSSFWIQKIQ